MIGEIIAEFNGKTTSLRVLPEGRVEASEQGSGSILGVEATILATAVSTPMQGGVALGEGDALVTMVEGEVVRIRKIGIGWSTGRGREAEIWVIGAAPLPKSPKFRRPSPLPSPAVWGREGDGGWVVDF